MNQTSWPDAPIPQGEATLFAVGAVVIVLAFVFFVFIL